MNKLRTSSRYFINAVLCVVLWLTFVYGSIAFITLKGNPLQWSWDARFFMVWFGFLISLFVGVASYQLSKDE